MSQLEAVAYVSSSIGHPSDEDLTSLLIKARAKNDEVGVTGALLYHDGTFFQYFEGPPDGVELVYDRIRKSTMHHGIIELMRIPIAEREFSKWNMGFTHAPVSIILQLSNADWHRNLAQHNNKDAKSDGVSLLLQFWRSSNRHAM